MTKAELINNFSEKVGVPDADSKMFFEILLKKLSAVLKPSQYICIPEFGYFHLIKGKIKRPTLEEYENNYEELIDIILYSSKEKLSQSEAEGFVFNIPDNDDENSRDIDSYFSLSIGKPLIPLRGYFDKKNFIPTSGYEYKLHLETKVNDLINGSEILFSEEQFPILIIDARSYNSNELHLETSSDDLDALLYDEKTPDENAERKTDENIVRNIAWDFGEIFSPKISAESIIDLTDERINQSLSDSLDNQTKVKDYSRSSEEGNILNQLLNDENQDQILPSEKEKKLQDKSINEEVTKSETDTEPDLLDKLIDYEEVQADEVQEKELKKIEDDSTDDEFWKNTSKLFEAFNPREIRSDDEKEFIEVNTSNLSLSESSNEQSEIKLNSKNKKSDEHLIEKQQRPTIAISLDNNVERSKKYKKWFFIIPALLIVIVAGLYYLYKMNNNREDNLNKNQELSISSDNASVIERDYKIPVSYPYVPESILKDSLDKTKDKIDASNTVEEHKALNNNGNKQNETTSIANNKNLIPEGRPISLGKNIYKYDNIYVVQVASFRSNQIAENEAGKYRNKGFNSFVEPVEIKDKGLWYRVKVGNFNSLAEAESFTSKNIR